jgi:hypothetical protein
VFIDPEIKQKYYKGKTEQQQQQQQTLSASAVHAAAVCAAHGSCTNGRVAGLVEPPKWQLSNGRC